MSLLHERIQFFSTRNPTQKEFQEMVNGAKRLEEELKLAKVESRDLNDIIEALNEELKEKENQLEASRQECEGLRGQLFIGGKYTCKCVLKYCNCNQLNTITKLTESEVTYKYLSTNINMARYWDEGTTTHKRFLELNQLTTKSEGGE